MAKELVVLSWCDIHQSRGEKAEGHTVEFGGKELELCQSCIEEFLAPVMQLVEKFGRQPEKARKKKAAPKPSTARTVATPRPVASNQEGSTLFEGFETVVPPEGVCPVCVVPVESQGLSQHMRQHGVSVTELYGVTCPLCGYEGQGSFSRHARQAHKLSTHETLREALRTQGAPHLRATEFLARLEQARQNS